MPPSSLNVVIFPHVMNLVLDDPKQWPPGDYWSNSRANLGRPPVSAKSIAGQLGISREQIESIIHEDLDTWKFSAKWVPKCLNAEQKRQRCQSFEQVFKFFSSRSNDFLSRLVTMDETWLYHYDPETKQQSIEWRHSGSPLPQKVPNAKIHWKISRLDFLGSRRHPLRWLSSKGPNHQRGVLIISAGAIEVHFEGNTPREVHQRGLVLAWQCPDSPGTCSPEETDLPGLPVSWSRTQLSGSGPVGIPPVPWAEWVTIFRPTWRSLLPRRPGWTYNLLNCF